MCGCNKKISGMSKNRKGIGSTQKKILAAAIGVGAASAGSIGINYFKDDLVGLVTKEGATADELQTGRHIVNGSGIVLGAILAYTSTMLTDETMAGLAAGLGVGVAAECATSLASDLMTDTPAASGMGSRWNGQGRMQPYNNNNYGLRGIDNNSPGLMGIDNNSPGLFGNPARRNDSGNIQGTLYKTVAGTLYKGSVASNGMI